jgi:hypothetical protein
VEFIHSGEAAGTSIEQALGIRTALATTVERIAQLGRDAWNRRFSFGIVRNPWDKVVSQYCDRRQRDTTQPASDRVTFRDWVQLTFRERHHRYYDDARLFMPQTDWLVDAAGAIAVNRVVRFETLEHDFEDICRHLGRRAALPTEGPSQQSDYRNYYDEESQRIVAEAFRTDLERFGYEF